MKRNIFSLGRGLLLGVMAVVLLLGVLEEAKAAPYYQGKVIVFVVPSSAGGGTDVSARVVARHFTRFIPGNPSIVIRNIPGGGQLIGPNLVWKSKPDGLTLLAATAGNSMQNVIRPKGADFKLEEMPPIYAQPEGFIYFCKPGLIKEPKDILTAKGLVFGHNAPIAGGTSPFLFAKEILGFECKMVLGYQGSGPARLAFHAGESNISGDGTASYLPSIKPLVDKGEAVPLFQTGIMDAGGNIVREKAVSNIPTFPEFYNQVYGRAPSGPAFEVYKLVASMRTLNGIISLPPKTSAGVVDIWRKAAVTMVKDPKFLDDAVNPGATYLVGEDLISAFRAAIPRPAVVEYMKNFLTEKYGVRFD